MLIFRQSTSQKPQVQAKATEAVQSMESTATSSKKPSDSSEALSRSVSATSRVTSQPEQYNTIRASSHHAAPSTLTDSTSTSVSSSNAQSESDPSVLSTKSANRPQTPQDETADALYFGSNDTSRPPVMWAKPVGTSTMTHAVSGGSGIVSVVTYSGLDEGGLPASTVWVHWLILIGTGFAVVAGTSGVEVLDPYAAEVSAECASKYFSGRITVLMLLASMCWNYWR